MSDPATLTDTEVIRRYERACAALGRQYNHNPYHHDAKSQENWERWHAEVLKRGLMGQVNLK